MQETAEKWSVEVETRSVEVEGDQVGPGIGRKCPPVPTPGPAENIAATETATNYVDPQGTFTVQANLVAD